LILISIFVFHVVMMVYAKKTRRKDNKYM
jgi:hypothetical protein